MHLADRTPEALEAIREAEALAERSEERWWCAELYRLRGVFLVAMGTDDAQIEAAFCTALRTVKQQKSISLLKRAGRSKKPVLLKRGMSATLEEFLMAAEYIMSEGNYNVILCERGVRTFADHTRNTLDLSIIPAVQRLSHLPILVDPSHGTGKRNKVTPMARAALT